jgi:hypothetical protein
MLARLFRQAWLWSAYGRLFPLWHLLRQVVPEIELPLSPACAGTSGNCGVPELGHWC